MQCRNVSQVYCHKPVLGFALVLVEQVCSHLFSAAVRAALKLRARGCHLVVSCFGFTSD